MHFIDTEFLVNLHNNKVDETISFCYEVRWCVRQFHSDFRAHELCLHLYCSVLLALLISGLSGKNVDFQNSKVCYACMKAGLF
jgi:hypothetical protein